MANSNQSSTSLVDAFFRLFSSSSPETTQNTTGNFDKEWKRQNADPVPGVVRPVRSSGEQQANHASSASNPLLSHSLPDMPALATETPSRGSLKMNGTSIKHSDLTRSSSSLNAASVTPGSSLKSSRSGVVEEVPFVIVDPRIRKFKTLLSQETVDVEALGKLTWNGVIDEFRGSAWRILLGYSPPSSGRRESVLTRKREEYRDLVNRYYANLDTNELKPEWLATISAQESGLIHQIRIDVPRTLPHNHLFSDPIIQRSLERILLMWALRHPASGYVQGINDLVTPFLVVFLREILDAKKASATSSATSTQANDSLDNPITAPSTVPDPALRPQGTAESPQDQGGTNPISSSSVANGSDANQTKTDQGDEEDVGTPRSIEEASVDSDASSPRRDRANSDSRTPKKFSRPVEDLGIDLSLISQEEMALVEADSYWAVSKFIDCIQDNYTAAQPGIQRSLHRLGELVGKIDPPLAHHLNTQGVLFVQFAFRWINCLLMRELPLNLVIRLWDTYISEGDRFPTLHTYVCASFLLAFSTELLESDFQNLMMFLHHLPTESWTVDTLEPLISQAFMWQTLYGGSSQHFRTTS